MFFVKSIFLEQDQMEEILDDFSQEVSKGRCERMSYSLWKSLKETKLVGCHLYSDSDNNEEIRFTSEDYGCEMIARLYLNTEKVNFGDFLYERKFNINRKENREMNNSTFNFDFGAINNDNIHMSPYGIAIKNKDNKWVSYDANSGKVIDVNIFNFNGNNMFYKIPVAIKDIKVGDVIIHQRVPMYVTNDIIDNKVVVIDPVAGEEKVILPTTSPFGFDFITKVVSVFDMTNLGATSDTPFGSMLPFMMMGEDSDIDPMMLVLMSQGAGAANNLFANPLMLYFLCGDKSNKDNMLPLMLMMNQNNK